MSLEAGQVFAGYTIVRLLGAGGMGAVYVATHPRLPRQDALKVLPPELTANPEYRARFLREAVLAGGLSHPHIVRIHDRGEEDGQFWISMDYVAGTDAARLLHQHYPGGMPLDQVVPIVAAVASALDYAHHRRLLHRDVKPANILLAGPDGQPPPAFPGVFLADFGVARRIDDASGLTAVNMTMGTADYAAPEQLRGQPVDGRTDQYALACTAFELLTGAPPFADPHPGVVITRHVTAPPPPIGARRPELTGLDPVFAIAMAKNPADRFASCQDFARHLGQFLNAAAYPRDTPPTIPIPPPGPPRRRPAALVGALAAAVLIAAAIGVVAIVVLTKHGNPTATPIGVPGAGPSPPFNGVYRADFAAAGGIDGQPGRSPTTETWGVRSACGQAGCVATASRLGGDTTHSPTIVLDEVDGRWVAVTLSTSTCGSTEGELWEAFILRADPDGTFSGETTNTMAMGCVSQRTVTFTRMSGVDLNSLPDPASVAPRVASAAAGLHGRYQEMEVQPDGSAQTRDWTVTTTCLRSGDRCLSLFRSRDGAALEMLFSSGRWVLNGEYEARCREGGVSPTRITAQFPLAAATRDPIARLAGHGHEEPAGSRCPSTDVDMTFTRTGN